MSTTVNYIASGEYTATNVLNSSNSTVGTLVAFTDNGTIQFPSTSTVKSVQAVLVGGGGSGGNSGPAGTPGQNQIPYSSGGGGGAGGDVVYATIPVSLGNTYQVTIGAGGVGANGKATFFAGYTAKGGLKGTNGTVNTGGNGGNGNNGAGGGDGGFVAFDAANSTYGIPNIATPVDSLSDFINPDFNAITSYNYLSNSPTNGVDGHLVNFYTYSLSIPSTFPYLTSVGTYYGAGGSGGSYFIKPEFLKANSFNNLVDYYNFNPQAIPSNNPYPNSHLPNRFNYLLYNYSNVSVNGYTISNISYDSTNYSCSLSTINYGLDYISTYLNKLPTALEFSPLYTQTTCSPCNYSLNTLYYTNTNAYAATNTITIAPGNSVFYTAATTSSTGCMAQLGMILTSVTANIEKNTYIVGLFNASPTYTNGVLNTTANAISSTNKLTSTQSLYIVLNNYITLTSDISPDVLIFTSNTISITATTPQTSQVFAAGANLSNYIVYSTDKSTLPLNNNYIINSAASIGSGSGTTYTINIYPPPSASFKNQTLVIMPTIYTSVTNQSSAQQTTIPIYMGAVSNASNPPNGGGGYCTVIQQNNQNTLSVINAAPNTGGGGVGASANGSTVVIGGNGASGILLMYLSYI